jgi:hypothetical protein
MRSILDFLRPLTQRTASSISSLLDLKTAPSWQAPERSVGCFRCVVNGKGAWEPKGEALALFIVLAPEIQKLLDSEVDDLHDRVPRNIKYNMWMVGRTPETSTPTIIFTSPGKNTTSSRSSRCKAMGMVKDSNILENYPSIALKALPAMPLICQAGQTIGVQAANDIDSEGNQTRNAPPTGEFGFISVLGTPRSLCGAAALVNGHRLATIGGLIKLGDEWYGFIANHTRSDNIPEDFDPNNMGWGLSFDEDSDCENDNFAAVTSRGSLSSKGGSETSRDETTSAEDELKMSSREDSPYKSQEDVGSDRLLHLHTPPASKYLLEEEKPDIRDLSTQQHIASFKSPYIGNDLDYELFSISNTAWLMPNEMQIPSLTSKPDSLTVLGVARTLSQKRVWVVSGFGGTLPGTVLESPHYIQLPDSRKIEEVWVVELDNDRKTRKSCQRSHRLTLTIRQSSEIVARGL